MERLTLALMVLGLCLAGTNAFASGIDEYTVLMLHCNGQDGSTYFPDDSDSNHSVIAVDNAQLDTSQYKFGGASALFDGSQDYLSILDSDDWDLGNEDFTIDFWLRFNNSIKVSYAISHQDGAPNTGWGFYYDPPYLHFGWSTDGSNWSERLTSWTPAAGTWYHTAVVRNGTDLKFFVDGSQLGDTASITATIYDANATFRIAACPVSSVPPGGYPLDGWMDEIRISKGIARWTSNFTPPTAEYDEIPDIPNNPPIAHAGPDLEAYTGDEVVLDGSFSDDSDGEIVSWVWRSLSDPSHSVVAEGKVTTMNAHGFVEELVELTVTDNRRDTDTDTMVITHPGVEGPQGPPGITPEEIAVIEEEIITLQQENAALQQQNAQQQQTINENRHLLEQLPQLKKDLEAL